LCPCHLRLLQLQWKQDVDLGLELISKAIEIDNKCDFAYETMGTIEVQRSEHASMLPSTSCLPLQLNGLSRDPDFIPIRIGREGSGVFKVKECVLHSFSRG
jgi:hypothetical protein